jgi:AcrR family transcriptional regulator
MVAAVARDGYSRASVSGVVRIAGSSRATFYQHFASREECFLAAHADLISRAARDLDRVEALPSADRARAALTTVLAGAERCPDDARVMVIGALGAPPPARSQRQQWLRRLEAAIRRLAGSEAPGCPRLQIPPRALIGGVEGVLARRLLADGSPRLGWLLFDLLDWIDSYRAAEEISFAADGPADSVVSAPSQQVVEQLGVPADGSRQRILAAVARLSVAKGFTATAVSELIASAHVSRASFYEIFPGGKEEAFHAAQTAALQASISYSAEAFFGADDWSQRVWNGLEALLVHTSQNPELAWLDTVESYAVGPAAIARSIDNRMAFGIFLQEGYRRSPGAGRLPVLCSEAIGAAIHEMLRAEVLAGRANSAPSLLPQVAYVALAPFLGAEAALDFIRGRVQCATRA